MKKDIDNIFIDVRNAFRLLSRYQKRILNIVNYIREQTPYTDMWGSKNWYSDEIKTRRNSPDKDYAKLNVYKDMWGLDFLYGHFFEYYFGTTKTGKHTVEMSIFQVSDDGFFISDDASKHMTNVSSYASAEVSHSYIVFNVSVYTTKSSQLWLHDPNRPEDDGKDFLTHFLESSNDTIITSTNKKLPILKNNIEYTILKKYEMQRFTSQSEADKVIADFAKLVKDYTGVEFFKENFY